MMRLDKFIADTTGVTRSQAGKEIRSGSALVNGIPVRKPEQRIDETSDTITVSGKVCEYCRFHYYMLNKPTGVITAAKDPKQKTVMDLFPMEIRKWGVSPVGRLDKDTSGLLLLTDNGEFAHRIISPKSEVDKVYLAVVDGILSPEDILRFREGIVLVDGTKCLPAKLEIINEQECIVTVREGKYHQVRRMLAALGKPVCSLKRVAIGPLRLGTYLLEGQYRPLTEQELCIMFKLLHMEK